MSGRFRLIDLGDISRDDHLEFTFLSNLIKKIISMRKFLYALFFSTTTIIFKCKNSQKVQIMMTSAMITSYLMFLNRFSSNIFDT